MKKWSRCLVILCVGLLFVSNTPIWASPADSTAAEAVSSEAAPAEEATAADPLHTVAGEKADPPSVGSPTAILIDRKTGTILYQKDANSSYYPASITKIMTALLVLENCSLDETVTFSYRATHELEEGATHIARTEGEEMSVRDCLYALLVASANEVAQALAEHVSGSIEDFAVLMTERARELGCTNTNFKNPSGLNDPDHYTTCHDMAIIMQAALDTPGFLEIDSTAQYEIPPTNKHEESTWIATKHPLINGDTPYEYAVAGKNGYTQLAGNSLVTYAVKGDAELICVIMSAQAGTRSEDTINLFEYGFNNFTWHSMGESAQEFLDSQSSTTTLEDGAELGDYTWGSDAWVVLPNGVDTSSLTAEAGAVTAEGDTVSGTVTYHYGQEEAGTIHYTRAVVQPAAETATAAEVTPEAAAPEEGGFPWKTVLMWAGIILGGLVVLLGLFFVVYNWQQLKHRRRNRNRYRMKKIRRRRRRRRW